MSFCRMKCYNAAVSYQPSPTNYYLIKSSAFNPTFALCRENHPNFNIAIEDGHMPVSPKDIKQAIKLICRFLKTIENHLEINK